MINESRKIVEKLKYNSRLDLNQSLFYFVRYLKKYIKSSVCSLYLLNRETNEYTLMATKGLKVESVRKVKLATTEGLVGSIAEKGETLNISEPSQHPKYKYLPQTGEDQFHSFLGVPITHQHQVLGVLVLQRRVNNRFTPREEAFILTLVAQLSELIGLWDTNGDMQRITRQDWRGRRETVLKAIGGSPGAVVGRGLLLEEDEFFNNYALERNIGDQVAELELFYDAIEKTRIDIKNQEWQLIGKIGDQERLLFTTYVQLLDDNNMGGEVIDLIKKGYTAVSSWSYVVVQHCQTFDSMDDKYLKERASDIRDLGKRLLKHLKPSESLDPKNFQDGTIIVAREVTASMLSLVPLDKLAGIVSIRGSNNSHLCILAKALEIPAVVGVEGLQLNKADRQLMALDGSKGRLYLRPTRQRISEFRQIRIRRLQAQRQLEALRDDPTQTVDGHSVQLLVNTGLMADAKNSLQRGAEGVGLYRSEVLFFNSDHMPGEYEQELFYRQQLNMFAPHSVTMRTMDVGGDKPLSFLHIEESNPFLGWRGIRISLDHPDWFSNQVKAMLRASLGLNNLKIMLPMISGITDLDAALVLIRRAFKEIKEEEKNLKMPKIGVMIEVPSAVYLIDEIASRVDFISVGSNDLTQYMLAVDRNNSRVANWFQPFHPAVIQAFNFIAKGTKRQNKKLSICGEIASDPKAIILLIAMGFDSLSMSSSQLMLAKAVVNAVEYSKALELLDLVLTLPSAEQIEAMVDGYISQLPELSQLLELST